MIVDQSKYTREYYIDDCEGCTNDGLPGPRIKSLLKYVPEKAKNILDIGCGRGEVAKELNTMDVISIDYSNAAMQIFNENNISSKTFIRHNVIDGLGWLREEFFDVIILSDVIEHIDNEYLCNIVNDIVAVVKINGLILIDTPITSKSCQSELHINLYESIHEVCELFTGTTLVTTEWYMNPEHCHIILRRKNC